MIAFTLAVDTSVSSLSPLGKHAADCLIATLCPGTLATKGLNVGGKVLKAVIELLSVDEKRFGNIYR